MDLMYKKAEIVDGFRHDSSRLGHSVPAAVSGRRSWSLRYAPHLGLRAPDQPLFLHSAGSADPVAQIEYAAALGFAGVFDNFLKIRPVTEQERIGAALARHGLAMGSFVNSVERWNAQLWNSADPAARAQIERDVAASVEAAQRAGGRSVTVTSGRDPDAPLAPQHAAMVENLRRVADTAARGGIVLGVEPTSEHFLPGMLVFHAADALAIVEAVDHPAVRMVFDTGHIQAMDGELLSQLERCRQAIGAIQVADHPGRTDLGTGEIDWVPLLRQVRAIGCAGLIELEHLPREPGIEGERALLERLAAIDAACGPAPLAPCR